MTEDEAKGKWCPHRAGLTHPKCIASECMAWRPTVETKVAALRESSPLRSLVGKDGWRISTGGDHAYSLTIERDTGYCGLAGKP